jgi:cytidine deaminase
MNDLIKRAIKKASKSPIKYRVAAIGFNKKGEVLGIVQNTTGIHLERQFHAEERLMTRYTDLRKILILRIGIGGKLRPIHPCNVCAKMAEKRGIKINPFIP